MKVILENNIDAAKLAAKTLHEKKAISFATDTVYGIAVNAMKTEAVEHLYKIKKRDKNKPIAIFLPNLEMAKKIFIFDDLSEKIAKKFLPGPLTLVLKKCEKSLIDKACGLNENDDFLGFRIIESKFLDELFKIFPYPIAVTSANISGESALISAEEIKNNVISEKIDLLIDGGVCKIKIPSTVVKIFEEKITILRQGKLKIE